MRPTLVVLAIVIVAGLLAMSLISEKEQAYFTRLWNERGGNTMMKGEVCYKRDRADHDLVTDVEFFVSNAIYHLRTPDKVRYCGPDKAVRMKMERGPFEPPLP